MTESSGRKSFSSLFPFYFESSFAFSFKHLSFFLLLLLLSFFTLLPGSDASFNPTSSFYARRSFAPHNFALSWNRRLPRSPFLPPTVTSFHPSIRRPPNKKSPTTLRVSETKVSVIPPYARSRSAPVREKTPIQDGGHPMTMVRKVSSTLPRPPMVLPRSFVTPKISEKNEEKPTTEQVSILPQNDQHSLPVPKVNSSQTLDDVGSVDEKAMKESKLYPQNNKKTKLFEKGIVKDRKLTEFYEVINAINKTSGNLQKILNKENISLDHFLGFIENGVTKEQILDFLKLSPDKDSNTKLDNQNERDFKVNSFSRHVYENDLKKGDRQKILTDFPFTEIVHKFPEKSFDDSYTAPAYKTNVEFSNHHHSDISSKKKIYPKKWNKNLKENDFNKKLYKNKYNKHETEKNPFLMNSDFSTGLPSKDSPLIIPFLPPKRHRDRKTKDSASIINLTVEEIEKTEKDSKVTSSAIPIRNKVLSTKSAEELKYSNEDLTPSKFANSKRSWNENSHEQSNLRMVFPMKGILLFCGILGIIAVVTILILIIYGTVKCNKKPSSNSYQMSEHRDPSPNS